MSDAKPNLDSIREKVRALLSKTVANGATEAEAMAAAAKARELLDRYQITMTQADLEDDAAEGIEQRAVDMGNGRLDRVAYLATAIAKFADVKTWQHQTQIVFFGFAADAELAGYLLAAMRATRDAEFIRYQRGAEFERLKAQGWHGRQLRTSFTDGFILRVAERLEELKRASQAVYSNSRALVPVKGALITSALEDLDLNLKKTSRRMATHDNGAREAGYAAGDRANLSRPLASDAKPDRERLT